MGRLHPRTPTAQYVLQPDEICNPCAPSHPAENAAPYTPARITQGAHDMELIVFSLAGAALLLLGHFARIVSNLWHRK